MKSLLALCCVALLAAAVPFPQERVKKTGPEDFHQLVEGARKDWDGGQYGPCLDKLKQAMGLVAAKRADSTRAALPAAPEGWEIVADRNQDAMANNPFAAAMQASVGSIIEQRYQQTGGRGNIQVTLTADSPMGGMLNMWATNPAMMEPGSELITYGEHKAVLKSAGESLTLTILIHGKHVCEVNASGLGEDGLFAMFDQAAVDKLARVLGN